MPPACMTVMLSELAAGSSSWSRRRGSSADRVGWLTAKNACCTAKSVSSSHTSSAPSAACSQKPARGEDQPDGRDQQQRAPVEDVGQRAAPEPEDHERDEAEDARQADVRRRAGHRVDLRGHRHDGELGADDGDDVGQPQPAEVRVGERPGVRQQSPLHLGRLGEPRPRRPRAGRGADGTATGGSQVACRFAPRRLGPSPRRTWDGGGPDVRPDQRTAHPPARGPRGRGPAAAGRARHDRDRGPARLAAHLRSARRRLPPPWRPCCCRSRPRAARRSRSTSATPASTPSSATS